MLNEFALTPDLFDAAQVQADPLLAFTLLEVLRDLCERGLLANTQHGAWVRHAYERTRGLSPALRDKVLRSLITLHDRHRLIAHPPTPPTPPRHDCDWLRVALAAHERMPLHAIVHGLALVHTCPARKQASSELCLDHTRVLDAPGWRDRPRTLHLLRTAHAYRTHLAGLLRYARTLDIIDPFLSCHRAEFVRLLDLVAELLGQRSYAHQTGRVRLHTGDPQGDRRFPQQVPDRLRSWGAVLQPLADRSGHRFEVLLWGDTEHDRLHDRYLLTDQCGVLASNSFECFRTSSTHVVWSLLDQPIYQRCRTDFDPAAPRFVLLGRQRFLPTP